MQLGITTFSPAMGSPPMKLKTNHGAHKLAALDIVTSASDTTVPRTPLAKKTRSEITKFAMSELAIAACSLMINIGKH